MHLARIAAMAYAVVARGQMGGDALDAIHRAHADDFALIHSQDAMIRSYKAEIGRIDGDRAALRGMLASLAVVAAGSAARRRSSEGRR
jgi:hypothetical protein